MLQDAKYLLSQGISVIPIKGRTGNTEDEYKKPVISWKLFQQRLPSMKEIVEWFQFSRYNLAIVTGQISRLLVLDIDDRHNGTQSIANKLIPNTWQDKTPGGSHYYFRWHPTLNDKTTSVSNLLPGVDIRGNGGYVIVPPSVGYNGLAYSWIKSPKNTPLAYPPPWLLDAINKQVRIVEVANKQGWIAEALAGVKEGNRDQTFIRLAGRFWHDGLAAEEIFELLKPHAERVGFSMEELQLKVSQIQKYPRNEAINEANIEEVMNIESFMKSDEDELKWHVDGVFPEQSAVILGGMQGLGKTWLMLDLAIELARGGGSWLNKLSVNPASVLYVDEESSNRLLRYRLKKLISAKGLKIKDLQLHLSVGHNFNFSNPESVEKFKRLLDKVKPSVVFIDSLVRIHRGEENSSTEMSGVFKTVKNLIRQFNCSFLFADHEGKAAYHHDPKVPEKEPSSNDLRGSNEKAAFVDTVLSLKRKDGELYLYHTKSRHAEAIAPFLIKIEDLDEAKTKLAVRGY